MLSGGEGDPRMTKIINRKLTLLAMADVDAALGLASLRSTPKSIPNRMQRRRSRPCLNR